jgi:hypothetical protein
MQGVDMPHDATTEHGRVCDGTGKERPRSINGGHGRSGVTPEELCLSFPNSDIDVEQQVLPLAINGFYAGSAPMPLPRSAKLNAKKQHTASAGKDQKSLRRSELRSDN